jgi:mRNA-degrading endonuclease RelE of RelBE toxin-antitoxin system
MPSELAGPVQVEYTPEFRRNLRALARRYRHIRSDVQPVIDQLRASEVIGDQVPRTHYTIFKIRVRNSDIRRGKQSGYRLDPPLAGAKPWTPRGSLSYCWVDEISGGYKGGDYDEYRSS